MKEYMRVIVGGGGGTLPWGRLSTPTAGKFWLMFKEMRYENCLLFPVSSWRTFRNFNNQAFLIPFNIT